MAIYTCPECGSGEVFFEQYVGVNDRTDVRGLGWLCCWDCDAEFKHPNRAKVRRQVTGVYRNTNGIATASFHDDNYGDGYESVKNLNYRELGDVMKLLGLSPVGLKKEERYAAIKANL